MTEPPAVASPDAAVSAEFAELASDERIATAAAALERNGIRPLRAATGADARGLVRSLLTGSAEVYNGCDVGDAAPPVQGHSGAPWFPRPDGVIAVVVRSGG